MIPKTWESLAKIFQQAESGRRQNTLFLRRKYLPSKAEATMGENKGGEKGGKEGESLLFDSHVQ